MISNSIQIEEQDLEPQNMSIANIFDNLPLTVQKAISELNDESKTSQSEMPLKIAKILNEDKLYVVKSVCKNLPRQPIIDVLIRTIDRQQNGGVKKLDGSGQKTPGGIFLTLLKQKIEKKVMKRINMCHKERKKENRMLTSKLGSLDLDQPVKIKRKKGKEYVEKGTDTNQDDIHFVEKQDVSQAQKAIILPQKLAPRLVLLTNSVSLVEEETQPCEIGDIQMAECDDYVEPNVDQQT